MTIPRLTLLALAACLTLATLLLRRSEGQGDVEASLLTPASSTIVDKGLPAKTPGANRPTPVQRARVSAADDSVESVATQPEVETQNAPLLGILLIRVVDDLGDPLTDAAVELVPSHYPMSWEILTEDPWAARSTRPSGQTDALGQVSFKEVPLRDLRASAEVRDHGGPELMFR